MLGNGGGDAPLSPPCDPPSGKEFSTKIIFLYEKLIIYLNPFLSPAGIADLDSVEGLRYDHILAEC